MRLRAYRDKDHSLHLDLLGNGVKPWTVDLVSTSAAAMLVTAFACALAANLAAF